MQLVDAPSEILAEPSGFTLVEEDDVAFGLRLCREVHRLYNDYQDGTLPATDPVRAGLMVTVEMLALLSRSVKGGMPAMRIMVAAAQTREMLAVEFDHDPMERSLDPQLRGLYRSMVTKSAQAVESAPRILEFPHPVPSRPASPVMEIETARDRDPAPDPAPIPTPIPVTGLDARSGRGGWFRRFGRRRRWSESPTP